VREERAFLGYVANLASLRWNRVAGSEHGFVTEGDRAGVRVGEPGDQAQQRGLATAGRAEHRGQAPLRDVQADPAQHLGGTKGLVHIGDGQRGHRIDSFRAARVSKYVAGAEISTISAA
jgi:hypothetical protein